MAYDPLCEGCPERESNPTPLWGGKVIENPGCDGSKIEECKREART